MSPLEGKSKEDDKKPLSTGLNSASEVSNEEAALTSKEVEDILSDKIPEILSFISEMDVAATPTKAQVVVDYIAHFNQLDWERKENDKNSSRDFREILQNQEEFLKQYLREKDLPSELNLYSSIYNRPVEISEDRYMTVMVINEKGSFLTLSKDNNDAKGFDLVSFDSQSEIEELEKNANEFAQRKFPGDENEGKRAELESDIEKFFKLVHDREERKATLDLLDEHFNLSDHPDFPLTHGIGSASAKVPELNPVTERAKIEDRFAKRKREIEEFEKDKEKKKSLTLAELTISDLEKPFEDLIKKDKQGGIRALTKEEIIIAYRAGALRAITIESYEEKAGADPKVRNLARDILRALKNEDMGFKYKDGEGRIFSQSLNFSEIKENALSNVLRVATIPRDEKTWVFSLQEQDLYQTAHGLMKSLGIDQKMVLLWEKEREYDKKDYLGKVVREAHEETKANEKIDREEEKIIDFYNRFLEKLHYSYKVDPKFKKQIDELRDFLHGQISPKDGESFRFITERFYSSDDVTAYTREFAMRTGENASVIEPYFIDTINEESSQKEDAIHFLTSSPLYEKRKNDFEKHNKEFFNNKFFHRNRIIRTENWEKGCELSGGFEYLKHVVCTIFTYQEIVNLLQNKECQYLICPTVKEYETAQFSIPGGDFTRPDEERSFNNMFPEQLFQTVENLSLEEWQTHENDILNKYAHLALQGGLKENVFLHHLKNLSGRDWDVMSHMSEREKSEYRRKKSTKMRSIVEIVLKAARPDFLNDETLAQYYSEADTITEDGRFLYFKEDENRNLTTEEYSLEEAMHHLAEYDSHNPRKLSRESLHALSVIMDIVPDRIGQTTMNFLVAMASAASKGYGSFIGDTRGWTDPGVSATFQGPFEALDFHPEHFSKLLNESNIDENTLFFLLGKGIYVRDSYGLSGGMRDIRSFLSEDILQEMVRQNSLEGNQFKILKILAKNSPKIAGDAILKEWRKFDNDELNALLGLGTKIDEEKLETMEALTKEHSLKNSASALFLTLHPDFEIETVKSLDALFVDDSVQVIFSILNSIGKEKAWSLKEVEKYFEENLSAEKKASDVFLTIFPDYSIETVKFFDDIPLDKLVPLVFHFIETEASDKTWSVAEVKKLYKTTLWKNTSHSIRNQHLKQILKFSKEERIKFFAAFSGKNARPQKNRYDIYPLNIPKDHTLYDKYHQELKSHSMEYSTFVQGVDSKLPFQKESKEGAKKRMIERSKLLFNDMEVVMNFPQEELSRRINTLKEFETKKTEIDNTAYRLLMIAPEFDELFEVLEENFDSLKNLNKIKKEITALLQSIITLNPELKKLSQKAVIKWASEKMGITSRRRFYDSGSQEKIKATFHEKLKDNDLGLKVNIGDSTEAETNDYMTLMAVKELLKKIIQNVRVYKQWLKEISETEDDPQRLISGVIGEPPSPEEDIE